MSETTIFFKLRDTIYHLIKTKKLILVGGTSVRSSTGTWINDDKEFEMYLEIDLGEKVVLDDKPVSTILLVVQMPREIWKAEPACPVIKNIDEKAHINSSADVYTKVILRTTFVIYSFVGDLKYIPGPKHHFEGTWGDKINQKVFQQENPCILISWSDNNWWVR